MSIETKSKEEQIWEVLQEVKDPEIPVISVVDMGIITKVVVKENEARITMTPTFVGCPAIDFMKNDIKKTVEAAGFENVEVKVDFETRWSTNLITEKGKEQLKNFGLSPPPKVKGDMDAKDLEKAKCPKCGSTNTSLNNPFGPTLCRAIHQCYDCGEAFEQFKPV